MSYLGNNSTPILLNGIEVGWSAITISVGNIVIKGVKTIDYGEEQDAENIMAAGGRPYARGVGNRTATASITLLKSEFFNLQLVAKNLGFESVLDLPLFDITVVYQPVKSNATFYTDIIKNCQFTTTKATVNQGDKSIDVPLTIVTSHVEYLK